MKDRNRIRGCLLGSAIGDALGYPVEFLSHGAVLRFLLQVSLPIISKGATPVYSHSILPRRARYCTSRLSERDSPGRPDAWQADQAGEEASVTFS